MTDLPDFTRLSTGERMRFNFAVADDGIPVGEYAEDPDVVPAWVIRAEAWHRTFGRTFPSARTGREHLETIERYRALHEGPPDLLAPWSPVEAAERFLGFLRSRMGNLETETILASDELAQVYANWCTSEGRHQAPENFMRAALKRFPGVDVQQIRVPGPGRKRTFTWVIRQMRTVSEVPATVRETVPFRETVRLAA